MICRRCLVSGRVQGVFYRATTARQAAQHGLTGHAINLPDGRVEVLLCGAPQAVDAVRQWLWEGPEHARVTGVECETVELTPPAHFSTG